MDTSEIAEQTRQKVQSGLESAQELKQTAQEWSQKAKGTARDAGAAADLYLHEYAWTSMVLVAVLGVTVGYLLGARRR